MVTSARLFTTPPNWQSDVRVTYQYATTIVTSRSGKEQRSADRQTPRKTIEFDAMVHDEGLRAFNRFMAVSHAAQIVMPEFTRSVLSTGSMGSGGTSITVASIPQWLKAGRTVALVSGSQWALRQVSSVASLTLNFDSTDTNVWPVGTKVYSGVIGRLAPSIDKTLRSNNVAETAVAFDGDPGLEPADTIPAAATTFNGREVFPFSPNWKADPQVKLEHPVERIDFSRGRIQIVTPIAFSSRIFSADFWGKTAAEAESVREFFDRQKGRRGEFYTPTFENDLPLKSAALSGATSFRVAGPESALDYDSDPTLRAVQIVMNDGTKQYARVSNISLSSGDSQVNLSTALTGAIDPGTVRRISWMPACRLASDELLVTWRSSQVAEIRLAIQTLEDRSGS